MPALRYQRFKVVIETPYQPDLVDALKSQIPSASRTWDASARVWTVYSPHVTKAREIVLSFFPHSTEYGTEFFQEEQEKESARQQRERQQEEQRRKNDEFFERAREQARQSSGFNFGGGRYRHSETGSDRDAAASGPYATLYVTPNAPKAVIDAVYKTLAKLYHPDVEGGNAEKMRALNDAYDRIKKSGA